MLHKSTGAGRRGRLQVISDWWWYLIEEMKMQHCMEMKPTKTQMSLHKTLNIQENSSMSLPTPTHYKFNVIQI